MYDRVRGHGHGRDYGYDRGRVHGHDRGYGRGRAHGHDRGYGRAHGNAIFLSTVDGYRGAKF